MVERITDLHQVRSDGDERLVWSAAHGDPGAFDELAASRLESAFRTAVAILGDPADAADAVQEAFIAAWRELPRLRDPERFDAWFGRILVNSCRLQRRHRHRRGVREIALPTEGLDPTDRPHPADLTMASAERDSLERAFDRLSVDQRVVIVRHHLHGRSLESIAHELGIPVGTVKSRHHAGRRALAAALEAEAR